MDQITQSINGITYPTIAEKHQDYAKRELGSPYEGRSHNCDPAPAQSLVGFDLDFHCIE